MLMQLGNHLSMCDTPPWHILPERRSPRAPAQDIWPHVTTVQHNGNHYTIRHKKCYKWFTRPSRHDQISSQAWLRTEFNWQRKTTKATAWSGSTPQASGWATDPSTLLLHLLAKVEDESSPTSGHKHKAREYICMHSARIATHYKQSNNHTARYILEINSYNMARCTLDS